MASSSINQDESDAVTAMLGFGPDAGDGSGPPGDPDDDDDDDGGAEEALVSLAGGPNGTTTVVRLRPAPARVRRPRGRPGPEPPLAAARSAPPRSLLLPAGLLRRPPP